MSAQLALTTSQIAKAGRTIRRALRGEEVPHEDFSKALDILFAFRAEHSLPLTKANMGLRSMVKTEGCRVEVSQRLKRVPTIADKLMREPSLSLAKMQDIGGCRAVLASIDEVRRVEARLKRRRPVRGYSDYINAPPPVRLPWRPRGRRVRRPPDRGSVAYLRHASVGGHRRARDE